MQTTPHSSSQRAVSRARIELFLLLFVHGEGCGTPRRRIARRR